MIDKTVIEADRKRDNGKIPKFQKYFRLAQSETNPILKSIYKRLFRIYKQKNLIELSVKTRIGKGLYFGHPIAIVINENAVIGENCNIHKGVTIGAENRGKRKGVPTIGNSVYLGINCTIVGNIKIGNNVLIAPNTFVNCDIPDNSIVFGNPCIIKEYKNATEG